MANPNPPIVNGDILLITAVCYDDEQVSMNRFGYQVSNSLGGGVTLLDAVQNFDSAASAPYIALLNNQANYRGAMGSLFVGNRLTPFVYTFANTGAGTAGADALPRQTCGMFTKVSPNPGPHGRGRVYVPFPAVADNGAGPIPNAGYMVRLGALAAMLRGTITVAVGGASCILNPVLVRYPRPSLVPPITLMATPWTDATARQKWATQRRRGSYGRPNVLPF